MGILSRAQPDFVAQWLACQPMKPKAGWIPRVGTYFQSVFSSSLFSILTLNYFIEKGHQQNDRNGQPLIFYIELCMKSMGVGLDLGLQKDN